MQINRVGRIASSGRGRGITSSSTNIIENEPATRGRGVYSGAPRGLIQNTRPRGAYYREGVGADAGWTGVRYIDRICEKWLEKEECWRKTEHNSCRYEHPPMCNEASCGDENCRLIHKGRESRRLLEDIRKERIEAQEIRKTDSNVCKNYIRGFCKFGSACTYVHPEDPERYIVREGGRGRGSARIGREQEYEDWNKSQTEDILETKKAELRAYPWQKSEDSKDSETEAESTKKNTSKEENEQNLVESEDYSSEEESEEEREWSDTKGWIPISQTQGAGAIPKTRRVNALSQEEDRETINNIRHETKWYRQDIQEQKEREETIKRIKAENEQRDNLKKLSEVNAKIAEKKNQRIKQKVSHLRDINEKRRIEMENERYALKQRSTETTVQAKSPEAIEGEATLTHIEEDRKYKLILIERLEKLEIMVEEQRKKSEKLEKDAEKKE